MPAMITGYEKSDRPMTEKMPQHAMGISQAILSRLDSLGESLETLDNRLRSQPGDDPGKCRANPGTLLDTLEMILDKVNLISRMANDIASKIGD